MRKPTIIITVILVAISIGLLIAWYALGLYRIDTPLDLIVDVVWWLVIAGCCLLVVRSEQARRRAIRTIYVSPTALYNSSTGLVPCTDPAQRPAAMRRILSDVDYGFHKRELPAEGTFDCLYVVSTDHYEDGDVDNEVRTWDGTVDMVTPGVRKPVSSIQFNGVKQLSSLMA